FIAGVLLTLTGIRPEVGFNLAVPTFFALTVAHTFALGYELARRAERRGPHDKGGTAMARWAGLAAVVFVAVMGNLSGALQMLERLARAGGAAFANATVSAQDVARLPLGLWRWVTRQASLPPFDYWYRATRVVPYTINEFPFFSFLFADLHPHMIAIPLTLLVVGLCLALILDQRQDLARLAARYLLLAVGIGALGVTNTWDLPTYWGLAACASLYRGHRLAGRRGLLAGGLGVLLLSLGSLLLYGPFYKHYQAQYVGITLVPPVERTTLAPFLVIWGFFLFVAVGTILYDLACSGRWRRLSRMAARWGWVRSWRRLRGLVGAKALWGPLGVLFLAGSLGGAALLAHRGDHVLALLLPLWIGAGVSALWGLGRPAQFLRRLMLFVALGILGGVEIIYMKDFLDGSEWRRMNTLFKFYIQAWVLLGLSLGSTMPGLWRHIGRGAGALRFIWRAGLAGLLAASLVYTVAAIPARVTERFPGVNPPLGTLDGTAYMYTGVYYWPDAEHPIELWYDRQALEWFWEHVPGTPVLAEAAIGFYREGGLRISSYTGLPTIVGAHEREQRPWDQVGPRERHAEAIYVTQDEAELLALLDRYRVRYIYIGQLERYLYDGPGLAKFEELARAGRLELVYHNEKTAVYRTAWR
ncbi:MAG: hypothetical protein H5T69_09990, partial [Chloroflexi bacterium]|nr:hypothetical protein [Chloroflexota bacterium]